MYSVSEVAKIFRVTPSTVRTWDAKGILKPDWVSPTRRRYYKEENVSKVYRKGIPSDRY